MSAAEVFSIVLGLVMGYWLVSAYFDGGSRKDPPKEPPRNDESGRKGSDQEPS